MLELAGDLGFFQEPGPRPGIGRRLRQHPLHRYLPPQIAINAEDNLPHAPLADHVLLKVAGSCQVAPAQQGLDVAADGVRAEIASRQQCHLKIILGARQ